MGRIPLIKNTAVTTLTIDSFLGADLTGNPAYISHGRSPDCPNIIRESAGKVRKWIGWHTVKQYDGQINGFHCFIDSSGNTLLIHAGTKLYNGDTVIYEGMADRRSVSKQLNGRLIIADGKKLLACSKEETAIVCSPVEDAAFVPLVTISRAPAGGGTTYQPVNLIGKQRKDSFLATDTDTVYQLSATGIDSVDKVELLNIKGGYDTITAYTADTVTGKITFSEPVGKSVVTGQDNLVITYSKTVADYADKINGCDIMALYGVNGASDRIFLSGNINNPNKDYYCQMDNPFYWGDVWYCNIGQDSSRIMGYSIIDDKLATHIDHSDNHTNIILRSGSLLEDGTAAFRLAGSYQGGGAVSRYGFSVLETEPLFLTASGVMAVTPSDVLGERYAQLRSYYLNGLLLQQDLSEAVATTYDRFYMLAVGGYLFALDGTQASVAANMPYASRQYEGFYRLNVPARVLANIDGLLYFGTSEGRVCCFYTDYSSTFHFNDDGEAIHCKWTTPEICGKNFYSRKMFRQIAVMAGAAVNTGMQLYTLYDGKKQLLADYDRQARYLSFGNIIFSSFTFRADKASQIFKSRINIKPDNRKAQFTLENSAVDQPLSLHQMTVEYTESR